MLCARGVKAPKRQGERHQVDKEVSGKQIDDGSIMHWFVYVKGLASFS